MPKNSELKIQERNRVKKELSQVKLLIGFCYPNIYRVGMASLGLQLIYQLWNSYDELACERIFLSIDEFSEPKTLESNIPLSKLDVIAFTMQYEDDYTNILKMLQKAHIPLETKERNDNHPLIIAGGPCAQSNPIPMAPFVDAFLIGDLEPVNNQLITQGLLENKSKKNRLEALNTFPWMWVPSIDFYKKVHFTPKGDINQYFYPVNQIIPQIDDYNEPAYGAFGKTFLLEVVRGCNRNCSFCLTSKITHPQRNRSLKRLIEIYQQGIESCQVNKISIIGSGISDYDNLIELCQNILNDNLSFSLPSLRADKITPEIVTMLMKAQQKIITTAPEAGTEELRKKIRKNITDDEIIEAAKNASDGGLQYFKAYFILGLPGESDEDILGIKSLANELNQKAKKIRKISFSFSYFIPKPRTTFQNESSFPLKNLQIKTKQLQKDLYQLPKFECEFASLKWSRIQSLLSIGGEEISQPLKLASNLGGNLGAWRDALKKYDIKIDSILEQRPKADNFPWDFIRI